MCDVTALHRRNVTARYSGRDRTAGRGIAVSVLDQIIGGSASILALKRAIVKVAPTDGRVLITGENGTGKELVARAIHELSAKTGEFVAVNCAAIPENLVESELFGYEKGAFTGATQTKSGRFEQAHEGTIFLDEIGEMPMSMQVKLLRVLENREIRPVGGGKIKTMTARVIAATNRDIKAEVAAGRFREDLFYRLNVILIQTPSLSERVEDIPMLVEAMSRDKPWDIAAAHMLTVLKWPGNVRELQNVVQRVSILAEGERVSVHDIAAQLGVLDAATRAQMELAAVKAEHAAALSRLQLLEAEWTRLNEFVPTEEILIDGESMPAFPKCSASAPKDGHQNDTDPPGTPPHGSPSRYWHRNESIRCRCEHCKKGYTTYRRGDSGAHLTAGTEPASAA